MSEVCLIIDLQGDDVGESQCCGFEKEKVIDLRRRARAHYKMYYCYNRFMDVESMRPHSYSKDHENFSEFHTTKPQNRGKVPKAAGEQNKHTHLLSVPQQSESLCYKRSTIFC